MFIIIIVKKKHILQYQRGRYLGIFGGNKKKVKTKEILLLFLFLLSAQSRCFSYGSQGYRIYYFSKCINALSKTYYGVHSIFLLQLFLLEKLILRLNCFKYQYLRLSALQRTLPHSRPRPMSFQSRFFAYSALQANELFLKMSFFFL